jgi:hypothetical protein
MAGAGATATCEDCGAIEVDCLTGNGRSSLFAIGLGAEVASTTAISTIDDDALTAAVDDVEPIRRA